MKTTDPLVAFQAFLDGKKVSYCRPHIDYWPDNNGINQESYGSIDKYSPLFIFLNEEANTEEEATIYQIEEIE